MKDTDAAGDNGFWSVFAPTVLTQADVGTWVHLVGVNDAVEQTMTLFVNGTEVGSVERTAPAWDAAGALTIGASLWRESGGAPALADRWAGTIDTVYAFQGAVPASSINRIP
jgi:hypothetical protein